MSDETSNDQQAATMRAIVQTEFGGPEVLTLVHDAPVPAPVPTEVQVRVSHIGVNPVDGKTREGRSVAPLMDGFPITVGWDIAGTVTALGTGVNRFEVGDCVYGMPRFPRAASGYAEYVTSPSRHLARMPDNLDFATAASIPLPATTAYQIVHEAADVCSGQTVLVLGAGGVVGSYVVQFAKQLGATVIGHATGSKLEWLQELGVDRTIDYAVQEFDDPALTGGAITDVDVVVDFIGGQFGARAVPLTRPGGVVVGVPSGQQQELRSAAEQSGVRWTDVIVEPDHVALEHISALVAERALCIAPPRVAALADAAEVHRQMDARRMPKTVLRVST